MCHHRRYRGYRKLIYQARQGPNMLALMQERDESENTVVQYTSGLGLENMRRDSGGGMASGDSSFFHYDALGSTQELTDENEAVTDTYRYNAWGQILVRTGTTTNPHTYVGKERYYLTPDPLLYLLGLRYYDLRLGRFITLDPQRDDVDWYIYVANLPTAVADAAGLESGRDDRPCKVYYWIGDLELSKKGISRGMTEEQWRGWLRDQALIAKEDLEASPFKGYEVRIISGGTANQLSNIPAQKGVVGVAAASHGGCGTFEGVYQVFNEGTDQRKRVGVFQGAWNPVQGSATIQNAREPEFRAGYFGHCYSYWTTKQKKRKLAIGNIERCKRLYHYALTGRYHSDISVVVPSSLDRLTGEASMGVLGTDFLDFVDYFEFCCPLLKQR